MMLLGQIVSNTGRYTYRSIGEVNEVLCESAENLYGDVLGEIKGNITKYAPELKICVVPINPPDYALITLSAFELSGYAATQSEEMLRILGFLVLCYAGLTTARYDEAREEKKKNEQQKPRQ